MKSETRGTVIKEGDMVCIINEIVTQRLRLKGPCVRVDNSEFASKVISRRSIYITGLESR
jgi:hypothetical protein